MDDNDLKIVQGLKPHLGETPFIFDIGANRGNYTDFVLTLFPDAKMLLVEPNEMWQSELARKYSDNKNITLLYLLVGSKKQDAKFYYFTNHNDQISSIYRRPVFLGLPMKESVKPMTTVDAIMEFFAFGEVDFIKVDTEGAEFDVLKGAIKSLASKKIKFIQIEYGGTYPDAGITMRDVISFVNSLGYHAYSYNGSFTELDRETFVEDFHYDNYLISKIAL
jgi:FkbM family methyltransferase